ncbi:PHD finger protein EHD3 [Lolium perenne]|uniref:PHD finger protein EHD3 n=1 Tax=Lolium perenne TaxID=4522 RepID=UPI0021F5C57D|nr:PHD finger protein EHD3-like [Lolium perenne]
MPYQDGAGAARTPAPRKRRASGELPSSELVVTYKRRRTATRGASSDPGTPCATMVACSGNSCQDGQQMLASHWTTWRDTLEGFLESPGVNKGGGIQSCIRDALRYNCCQPVQQCILGEGQRASAADAKEIGSSVALKDATEASFDANTAMCNNALLDILVSEKFALLCDLLVKTFHVNKVHQVIDLVKIDTNMRNGNYAQQPELFNDDIQQIWEKFEQAGREMSILASNLPVISRASYQKQASGVSEVEFPAEHRIEETSLVGAIHKIPKDSNTTMQFSPCDSGHSTMPKPTAKCGLGRVCTCKQCGTSAEEEKSLICDGCDTTYHFDCVKRLHPAMKQIPATWHCPDCSNKGKGLASGTKNNNAHHDSLHGDCPLCDKLEVVEKTEPPEVASGIEVAEEREGSSVPSVEEDNEPDLYTTALSKLCKHCGTCEDDDKQFIVCGHPYCPYKFYHIRCLRTSQIAFGKQNNLDCWYCPSCLCRGCFKNKDDEEIALCDGCDEAYHIYCMTPKRTCVPKGHWYCPQCSVRRAREGLQKYEKSVLKKHKSLAERASQSDA